MGNSEEVKSCKPEKPSSPAPDQPNIQMCPDWAAMQAYYGHRVAVPPYFNSSVASGHAPHPYIWRLPQPMMPPYGVPYAAFYPHGGAHGGVYAHPGVPLGLHSHGHGVPSSPTAGTPLNMDTPAKSSGNTDRGLMKKLKVFDGLAMSIGNGNADSAEDGADHGLSPSEDTDGSSDRSDGNTTGDGQNGGKRSREGTPNPDGDGKTEIQSGSVPVGGANGSSEKVVGVTVAPARVAGKVGAVLSPSMATPLGLWNPPSADAKTSPTSVQQPCTVISNEAWLQNERELKRERRKQSNRESARRSRLRKQAEAEELGVKVESITAENMTLRAEISQFTENSEKLKLENAMLMEKLKIARLGQTEKVDDKKVLPLSTANLLSRVSNSVSVDRNDGEGEMYENNSKSGVKLRQLLDANHRTDAVAAG